MLDKTEYSTVVATAPDKDCAVKIARLLVERRLAACAQMFPIESVYLWKGEVRECGETALLIKSKTALFDEIKAAIVESHPFEVPEIAQIPITNGLDEYLKWIDDCASAPVA